MKLYKLELNLQQGLIHTGEQNTCNAVCAIYDRHRKKLIIRPEFKDFENDIIAFSELGTGYRIRYGDAFNVDTWDEKIKAWDQ